MQKKSYSWESEDQYFGINTKIMSRDGGGDLLHGL